jgi:MerR family transcriptional regulator, redox-sensitive transcriptional activator SoxR
MYPLLAIGDVAARSGIAISAIRFYEDRGLIYAERAESGHRRFHRSVLRRLAFITFAQKVGLSLEEIAVELGRLPADRVPTEVDWSELSGSWVQRIEARIAELERLKIGLTECIGCGCLSIDRCQLANPRDRAGARGPGPRYWIEEQAGPPASQLDPDASRAGNEPDP